MNNPPAFPVYSQPSTDFSFQAISEGMTLRDWFAGMALQGLATHYEALLLNDELIGRVGTIGIDKLQAVKAYRLADAMIAARETLPTPAKPAPSLAGSEPGTTQP